MNKGKGKVWQVFEKKEAPALSFKRCAWCEDEFAPPRPEPYCDETCARLSQRRAELPQACGRRGRDPEDADFGRVGEGSP